MPPGFVTAAKWIGLFAAAVASAYILFGIYIYLSSEAVIERRYTLPSSLIQASKETDAMIRAHHILTIAGCFGCHGGDLAGRPLVIDAGLSVPASNLRALKSSWTDGDFERAIRRDLTPDARAMWGMPSYSYAFMRDEDVEDIITYIRALPEEGKSTPRPTFNWAARVAVVNGDLQSASPDTPSFVMPADEGPRFDGGRYLANIACAQCHGGDLSGAGYAPDLSIAADYSRGQFFHLMRAGQNRTNKWLPTMGPLARARFTYLKDYEIEALYKYFVARKTIPAIPHPKAATKGQ
ncbi:MAG TPA: c-type cytochrome [Rhizomicrobium sp.]|jgi:cytochrome c553